MVHSEVHHASGNNQFAVLVSKPFGQTYIYHKETQCGHIAITLVRVESMVVKHCEDWLNDALTMVNMS